MRWADGGENDVSGGGAYTHMTMLAADADGLRNLFRLASLASLEGYFYKPRIDRELLHRYGKGIIATTGCPSGEVQTWLRIGDFEKACAAAAEFRDIFGPENFYLELMDHGLDIERRVRDDLLRLGKQLNLTPVATNDLHYTFADDADAHEVLLCVQSGSTLADPKRFKFDGSGYYLKSPARDARAVGRARCPGACDATLEIAERIGDYVDAVRLAQPDAAVPGAGRRDRGVVAAQGGRRAGWRDRFPGGVPEGHAQQAEYELDVICRWASRATSWSSPTCVEHAKREGIRVGPGRGSAAGALIAYALGITELDPIAHGLLFERFLNPERISMPDIDMDFDERRRGDMIRYATEKYGEERVAQIITYGTIKAKAAIKDAGPGAGLPVRAGRPDHQGDAAARDGQGHPARRHLRLDPPALPGGGRVPRPVRGRAGRAEGGRHRQGAGGAQAPVGRARGRRDPVPRAAARRPADPEARAGRRDHHPVGHGRLRVHRPAQDGLPRACATSPCWTTAWTTSRPTAASTWCWRSCRWTTRRRTSCWPAATRSACSSSTAARCARCCAR